MQIAERRRPELTLGAPAQEAAQERVIAIGARGAESLGEKAPSSQLGEHARGVGHTGEACRKRRRETRYDRSAKKEVSLNDGRLVEDLGGEVVEESLGELFDAAGIERIELLVL